MAEIVFMGYSRDEARISAAIPANPVGVMVLAQALFTFTFRQGK